MISRKDNPNYAPFYVVRKDNKTQKYYKKVTDHSSDAVFDAYKGTSLENHIDENGHITPARQQLHNKILNTIFNGKKPAYTPSCYITAGGPGSGKGIILNDYVKPSIQNLHNFVSINVDHIRILLPEYAEYLNEKDAEGMNKAAEKTHRESSYLADLALTYAESNKHDIIYDCTFSSEKHAKACEIMKANGYRMHLAGVLTSPEISMVAVRERAARTGRDVPKHLVVSKNNESKSVIGKILMDKTNKVFDSIHLYDNDGMLDKIEPKLIFKNGNVIDRFSFIKHMRDHIG